MGQVFLARDLTAQDRYVALKLLLPEFLDATADFMREFVLQRQLHHPSVPRVYDFGFGQHTMGEVPYFVMDYVKGVPLARAMQNLDDLGRAWPWVVDILRALDSLHRHGYLHRDLKPGNVLVSVEPGREAAATLIDYGIAVALDAEPEELFIGTPEYSAPDLMSGEPFDVRQDLYAIGLLLYELVTGRRPWLAEDPTTLWEQRTYGTYPPIDAGACPPALIRLIQDLLQAEIGRRPPTAAVVLERFVDAVGLSAPLETDEAFRHRLDAEPMAPSREFERAARNWHAGLRLEVADGAPHPPVLVFDDPSGFDGRQLMDDLCDRGAVGGARVVRISLTHRSYEPLESVEPALAVFRRLREQRAKGSYIPPLHGLAGAATMLTRLHGPTILSIEHLQRADVLTLELLASVFTGAANANLRVVATVDPGEAPVAPHAFETLVKLGLVVRVQAEPLALPQVRAWLDRVCGAGVVEESGARALFARSEGIPTRLRALVAEEFAQRRIRRVPHGYLADRTVGIGQVVPSLGATPVDDLLACLIHAFPEDVVRAYLGDAAEFMPYLLQSGELVRHDSGRVSVGDADRVRDRYRRLERGRRHALHRRLAEAIAAAPRFSGQASACAREWLRTGQPILATPHLVTAANDAADRMDAVTAAEHLSRAQNLLNAHALTSASEQAFRFQVQVSRTAVRLARIAGDFAAWREEATCLFEAAVQEGHVATMQEALEALVDLAAEVRDWGKLAQHAAARAALHGAAPADGEAIEQWAFAVRALFEGDLDEVEARVDAGLDLGPRPAVVLRLLAVEAEALVAFQQVRPAAEAIEALDRKAREIGTPADRAVAVLLAAANARERQRPAEALELLERLSTDLGDAHLRRISGRVELEFARCHLELGWLPTALDHAERARALAERDHDPEIAIAARVAEARTVALLGHPEDALELLGDVREDLHGVVSRALAFEVEVAETEVAMVALEHALPEELVDVARRLAVDATRVGARAVVVRAWVLAGRAALSCGRPQDAVDCAEGALELADRWHGVGLPRYYLLFLLARAQSERGDPVNAQRLLHEAQRALGASATAFGDPASRAGWLDQPLHAKISAGRLDTGGPQGRPGHMVGHGRAAIGPARAGGAAAPERVSAQRR